jgi:tetratricopeptide (TPR) repeat protein
MENSNNNPGDNYYSNLNRLLRYFSRKQPGFAFACFANFKIVPNINRQLIDLLAEMQIEVAEINLQTQSGSTFMQQLLQNTADALIVNYLGDWITQSYHQKETDISGFLQEINFAREELLALGKPILFWTNHKTNSLISNQAADLYTQRSISTLYFDEIKEASVVVAEVKTAFGEQFRSTEEYEAIELKIKLLKKQLQDAGQLNYPKTRIAVNLILPLANAYSEIDLHHDAIDLINQYQDNFDKQNAKTLLSLAGIYYKGKQYAQAIGLLNHALEIAVAKNDLELQSNINLQLGDAIADAGNLPDSLSHYKEFARLSGKLLKTFPQNIDYKYSLGRSFSRLGDVYSSLGNLENALKYFEDETVLFEELYEDFPQNVSFKNGLAISYEKLGKTHATLGNLEKALDFYEKFNQLENELYKDFPQNVVFKNNIAISYEKLGKRHATLGNLEKALKYFEDDTVLFEELHEAFPQNVGFKNGLAISYQNLGNIHIALGNLEKALSFYEKYNQLENELHEAFPQNVEFKNLLAISCKYLGNTYSDLGNLEKALDFYEKNNQLKNELHEAFPQNVEFKNGLAVSYLRLGHLSWLKTDKVLARKYYQKAQKLWEELVRDAPMHKEFQKNVVIVKIALACL